MCKTPLGIMGKRRGFKSSKRSFGNSNEAGVGEVLRRIVGKTISNFAIDDIREAAGPCRHVQVMVLVPNQQSTQWDKLLKTSHQMPFY